MGDTWSRTVQVPLVVTLVAFAEEDQQMDIPCPGCGRSLGLHQPDEARPTHLLGTCDCGKYWAAIEVVSDDRAMLFALPVPGELVASITAES
jgi:hypothetical protein